MKRKTIVLGVTLILLLTTVSPISTIATKTHIKNTRTGETPVEDDLSYNMETLLFGPHQTASTLDIKGIIKDEHRATYTNEKVKTKEVYFDPSQCILHHIDQRQVYLEIKGLKPFGSPGNPMLPMKTFVIEVPKNSEILEIGMVDVQYREIKNRLCIAPNPEPVFWSHNKINREESIDSILPNMEVYSSDQFFPGTAVSYQTGCSNEKKQVFVRVYPIQYIPKLGRTILITDGAINVYYRDDVESDLSVLSEATTGSVNVIITPPSLFDQAMELKNFHDMEGTSTSVVNTTWIYANYSEADDPPYEGYSNPDLLGWDMIHDYNYSLAKRIIAYLNDTNEHPDLTYVTLLGNARLVPPSYYYEFYWTPTDFFYASPDYDLVPNYFVGRLPVNNSIEAAHVIDKIKHWNATSDLFRNITVAGGKPFDTSYDIGEMITTDSINRGFFKGVNPTKYFKTEGSFDKINLANPLMGDTGLLYHIGHGSGSAWWLEGDLLAVEDVMNLSVSDTTPVVVSIACMNGAFDTHLVNMSFNISFGESILLSDAGGIAYIGGSRSNAGAPMFTLDEGYVNISKEPYMAGMLTYFMKAYCEGGTTLGNLTANAMMTYLENNDMSYQIDLLTFFAFVLLGDPALQLPARPTETEYQTPYSSMKDPLTYVDAQVIQGPYGFTEGGEIPLGVVGENMTVNSTTNSPTVDIKLIDAFKFENMTIEKVSVPTVNNNVSYGFIPNNGSFYSIRTITEDGREGWLYVAAAVAVDDDYNETTPGWNVTRWAVIQDAVNHSSDIDMIYVFNGTYYENILLNKSIKLIGEDSSMTIIDGGGQGDVVNVSGGGSYFYGVRCSISGFTITNSGENNDDAGIAITSSDWAMPLVYNNIVSNNNKGIYVRGMYMFAYIQYNTIVNNTYGIYGNGGYVFGNTISSNSYGIYLYGYGGSLIVLNNIRDNEHGLYLDESDRNTIMFNNFIRNKRPAQFYKSLRNFWINNYWDRSRLLPKLIFGRIGPFIGLIPWINIDFMPAKTPNQGYIIIF